LGQPYVGEIRMFGGNFAPAGWAFCDGSLLPISQYDTLFNLIGTTFGGDGQSTFALPDLRGRVPLHEGTDRQGTTFNLGEMAGTESHTLISSEMPMHSHPAQVTSGPGTTQAPVGEVWAQWSSPQFSDQAPNAAMNVGTVSTAGGNQPHENMVPFLTVSFIISLFGIFPSQF
jgi:microcystin-dependent protein